jgi:hypothetical protein
MSVLKKNKRPKDALTLEIKMKKFFPVLATLFLVTSTISQATSPMPTPSQVAVHAVVSAAKTGSNADIADELKMMGATYPPQYASAGAVLLSASCGFAGCSHNFIVTIPCEMPSTVNMQTRSVVAIVRVMLGNATILKVISEDQIADLLK